MSGQEHRTGERNTESEQERRAREQNTESEQERRTRERNTESEQERRTREQNTGSEQEAGSSEELHDIRDVCELFHITSRTLRYYEEKGLLTSTLVENSRRRKYSGQQMETIKSILLLRMLGIPVAKIKQLQKGNVEIRNVIAEHRMEIISAISAKQAEINLLEEAIHIIETGGDIFSIGKREGFLEINDEQSRIADQCADALLRGDFGFVEQFFSTDMKNLLPPDSLKYAWSREVKDAGSYVGEKKLVRDAKFRNWVYVYLKFEKVTLRLKFVFHQNEICGLWVTFTDKVS